jgi:glycosyltransferase involved in cell wall biosynthesis
VKILLTTPSYPPFNSGLGNAVQMQARMLIESGYDVEISTGGSCTGKRIDPKLGINVFEFRISGANNIFHSIRGDVNEYRNFLRSSKYDFYIFNAWQNWCTDIPLSMLSEIAGVKLLYSHGVSTNLFINKDKLRSTIRYLLWRPYWHRIINYMQSLDGIIFLSHKGVDNRFDDLYLAQKLNLKFFVVPNSVYCERRRFVVDKRILKAKQHCIISVGSYSWLKGHDFVIKSYALSNFKNKVPLRIFGQNFNKFTDELRDLALHLGIRNSMIEFKEGISGKKLFDEYQEASIFLCGSHSECQPLVLIDAMRAGLPFISRPSGCIPFMKGGIMVENEVQCAEEINRLLDNNSEWIALSEAGRSAAYFYSPSNVKHKLNNMLRSFA